MKYVIALIGLYFFVLIKSYQEPFVVSQLIKDFVKYGLAPFLFSILAYLIFFRRDQKSGLSSYRSLNKGKSRLEITKSTFMAISGMILFSWGTTMLSLQLLVFPAMFFTNDKFGGAALVRHINSGGKYMPFMSVLILDINDDINLRFPINSSLVRDSNLEPGDLVQFDARKTIFGVYVDNVYLH